MINTFFMSFILILFLSTCCLVESQDSVNVLKNTMPDFMKNKAIELIRDGFANQLDLNKITGNLISYFDNTYGAEWFSIIGAQGFVAHLNAAPQTLLWLQYNELEVIVYKPQEVLSLFAE